MIPVIEDYLSDLLDNKLSTLRSNPEFIGQIISMSPKKIESLGTFMQNTPIKVIKGYPRTAADLPCVCILLSSDNEEQNGLGDYGSDLSISVSSITEEVPVMYGSVDEGNTGVPHFKLNYLPLYEVEGIVNKTRNCIYSEDDYGVVNKNLGIVDIYSGNVSDEDLLDVTYRYATSSTEGIQVQFENNFRIEVWANNADLVVQLYYLTKWALLSSRDKLVVELGLYRQRLSGSDFQPAPSFFPEFVYRRGITFWCQVSVSTPVEEVQYISGIGINQTIDFDT